MSRSAFSRSDSPGSDSPGSDSPGSDSPPVSVPRGPASADFLSRLPQRPEIQELARLFEQGNYARLRERAAELESADAEVVEAARELVARTTADPRIIWLFVLSALLLLAITAFAYGKN